MNRSVWLLATGLALQSLVGHVAIAQESGARLTNISTRMKVLTGDDVMIAGFVIAGTANKTIAIVVTGPSLAQFGVANPLANPVLGLVRSSDQVVLAANDDWQSAPNAAELEASGFAPPHALESALLVNLAPGAYTAVVTGTSGGTGIAVAAVYEVGAPEVPLINISTRGRVLTGGDVMIGGFVVSGTSPKQVVVTGAGPSLAQYGIAEPLANPRLTLVRSSDQAVIAVNDDWPTAANAMAIQTAGLAPKDAFEPAILATLEPGAYTAILEGPGNSTGIGVMGVFEMPPPADLAPTVTTTLPPHGSSQFPVVSPVWVTFSEPMDSASIDATTFALVGPDGPVAGTIFATGNTASFTPAARLRTSSVYAGIVVGMRDLTGNPLLPAYGFAFVTRPDEPPPIVAGCPVPESDSELWNLPQGQPTVFRRKSGHVTSFRIPRPGSFSFDQGQVPVTPPSPYTEITVSRCPGVIEPGLHSQCRLASHNVNFNKVTAVDRPLTDNQNTAAGCLAPSTDQYYVNVRWTFPTVEPFAPCPFGEGGCGFSLQWAN